jgi:flagellar protein FlgJ
MLPIDSAKGLSQVQDTYLDQNSLNHVKAMGRADDPQALKEVAKKFEAIFVQQMLKNMRAANEVFAEDSYFNSNEMKFHQDMYDQQMSLNLTSGRGLGLADALYEQMARAYGIAADEQSQSGNQSVNINGLSNQPQNPFALNNTFIKAPKEPISPASGGKTASFQNPAEFIAVLKPYAEKAAAELNLDSDVLLAQAALETGWGRHVIHTQRGDNSFNLFNIKAGSGWDGDKVNVNTLEYAQGVAQQERADFRRYASYAESFSDYVNFLQTNPRYQQALAVGEDATSYADELQKAGYATDPAYAEKIKNILVSDPIRDMTQMLATLASDAKEL